MVPLPICPRANRDDRLRKIFTLFHGTGKPVPYGKSGDWQLVAGGFTIWRIFAPRHFAFCTLHFALSALSQLITFPLQYNILYVII